MTRSPFHALAATAVCATALSGCAEPFAVQRDTLGPFRVAALGAVDGQASAAIWAGQPLHAAPVELAWTLDGEPLGEGWGVAVPDDAVGAELGLTATAPDGTERRARVTVGEAPAPFEVARSALDLGDAWELTDRLAASGEPLTDGAVPEGLAARLEADVAGAAVHWMFVQGHGTGLRLDATTTDLLREQLTFDDGALTTRRALEPGVAQGLALALDGAGGNRWRWVQVPMGEPGPWTAHHGLRLDLGDVNTTTGLVAVTLAELDAESGAMGFDQAAPVDDLTDQDPLDCAPTGEPFRLDWLMSGRCSTDAVQGARVVLEVE